MQNQNCISAKLLSIIFICLFLISSSGCQTLKRKFTRKPKTEKENVEEVIYEPQQYPQQTLSNEDMYRNYYTFWRGWHQDLMEVLSEGQNHKKQVECITEIINNLNKMKDLLLPEYQAGLKDNLQKLYPIKEEIVSRRSNSANFYLMKMELERVRSKITKDYTIKKIKPYLIH